MSDSAPVLRVDRSDGVVTLTLNRPRRKNALSWQLIAELADALDEIHRSDADRVVVITGAGGDFCAGADLSDPDAPRAHPLSSLRQGQDLALRLHGLTKPVIAKVRGAAVGAGCNLALGCDLVLAAEGSRFCQLFSKRGLSIDFGGAWVLPRLVGLHKAKELALLGDFVSAEEALALGLVNRVLPDDELDAAVDDWARRLAAGPPIALSLTKRMLNASMNQAIAEVLEDESRAQAINYTTADVVEGYRAFMERREPRFTGASLIEGGPL